MELNAMNVVNESSLFTHYIVLWIRLFFTNKVCHLTGLLHLLGRSANVLCCSLKVLLNRVKWKVFLSFLYFTKCKIFQVFARVLSPPPRVLTHRLRPAWPMISRSSPANRCFKGREVGLIFSVHSEVVLYFIKEAEVN